MAFDSAMVSAVCAELENKISGARVDKIYQPARDEVILALRGEGENLKLLISASASCARVHLTTASPENPSKPPAFCMLLRRHLSGAKVVSVEQIGFERVIKLTFSVRDEMGYLVERIFFCEIMGRFSNLIFCDGDEKILGAVHTVDFSSSRKRQVLPGMRYELPPLQDKINPLTETEEGFENRLSESSAERDKFVLGTYSGISPLTAREIASGGDIKAAFSAFCSLVSEKRFTPVLILSDGKPVEYSSFPIRQYGSGAVCEVCESFGALLDRYFGERDFSERMSRKNHDITALLSAAEARVVKRLEVQRAELAAAAERGEFKRAGDAITAEIYKIKKGVPSVTLTDYSTDPPGQLEVALDPRLTPAANAQRYYKKYNKQKSAEEELTKRVAMGEDELIYLRSVCDALSRAATEAELSAIRQELHRAGYARQNKSSKTEKTVAPKPLCYAAPSGARIYCGRNNIQNDELTFKIADRADIWFHVKNSPGSHAILVSDGDADEGDMTFAAEIAAFNSSLGAETICAVDYTPVRYVKKPSGAKPGFVIYTTYKTAYVKPDAARIKAAEIKP